jgi:hypothetical protein
LSANSIKGRDLSHEVDPSSAGSEVRKAIPPPDHNQGANDEGAGNILLSRGRTDVFYDCAVSRFFVDIVKLALKPFDLCIQRLGVTMPPANATLNTLC